MKQHLRSAPFYYHSCKLSISHLLPASQVEKVFTLLQECAISYEEMAKEMAYSDKIRRNHFKQFMSLPAEEQLAWVLSHGYQMLSLLPEDIRWRIEELRNGTKKLKTPVQNSHKST